jgi:hypothetical protein
MHKTNYDQQITCIFNFRSEEAEWTFDHPSPRRKHSRLSLKPAIASVFFTFVPLKATQ